MTPKQHADLILEYPQLRLDAAWLMAQADAAKTECGKATYEQSAKDLLRSAELLVAQDVAYCNRMSGVRK